MKIDDLLKFQNIEIDIAYIFMLRNGFFSSLHNRVFFEDSEFDLNVISLRLQQENQKLMSEQFTDIPKCLSYYGLEPNEELVLSKFYSNETILVKEWADFIKYHKLFDQKFLPIGEFSHPRSSLLLIGFGENNKNEIWIELSNSMNLLRVRDNLITFCNQLHIEKDEFLTERIKLSNLYKNWNEDFWRIKDE